LGSGGNIVENGRFSSYLSGAILLIRFLDFPLDKWVVSGAL